ncbi:hypothetical protein Kpol_1024p18 [Vanderwaltozyma polyspora DSM 70294]|uniref:Uncharacterized protein n=1 Tax=Vanderwaltozyma polyspora (strain ATCC 22028 / DSM 70294 / BCRC 21397 / CBS 2163 / NBRC 10782 / NRRL Y-8283 / UCD 57-17) TaxID=436907 RepID=A7TLH9_VANPO|nr:uncharacterized protein Kpol_1024p18 [Vanderwaltozyma polyspora DSM 70294]EDO16865.1 hypothetical protein Kpol_1024p18 [Vanderwaltozyma polyspora DSM 70294]
MNSLYELDPKWRNLLSVNNFLGGLTVNEFVEELSKDQTLKGAEESSLSSHSEDIWKKLDPKPYIRTFESTLKELNSLKNDSLGKESVLYSEVNIQELNHSKNTIHLFNKLKSTISKYDDLDNKLSNVIQVLSPLGEKVENSIKQKKNYIKSIELIAQYNEFDTKGKSDHLNELLNSRNWQLHLQAVIIVKNLLILSRKVETSSIPKTSETTKLIEKYSESMENNLLEDFNNAYRENNFEQLNEIALVLEHFNGGVNVIQSFINQHSFFIDTSQIEDDDSNQVNLEESFKRRLLDPDFHGVNFEKSLVSLLENIETVIKNESKIVKRVFDESAPHVIQLFIQRIFVQKIDSKIDLLLNTSFSLSDLAFVRMLHALYTLVGQFVKDLVEFFKLLEIDQNNVISATIEQCYSDLFSKYLYDRSKYFDIERRSLESILIEKTSTFNISHEKETRDRSLNNKFNNKLETGVVDNNEFGSISKSKLSQINNFFKTHLDKERLPLTLANATREVHNMGATEGELTQQEVIVDEKEFNIASADLMLKCAVESVARVMELTPSNSSSYSYELLELLHAGIISSYVETSLEISYYNILKVDVSKVLDINVSFLKYLTISTDILSLLSATIKAVFLPLLTNSPDIKKKIIEVTNNQITRCELLINTVVDELTHLYSSKFSECLSKQKKKDFVPKSQDLLDQDTLPAIEIANILASLHSQVSIYFRSNNLTNFLTTIGDILYNKLLTHYGKFQVSSTGGIIVTKDIIGYQNVVEEWEIPELLEKFATLRELANLFTVQPELLDSLTKEGHLIDVHRNVISSYISNREDFNHEKFISGVKLNFKHYA